MPITQVTLDGNPAASTLTGTESTSAIQAGSDVTLTINNVKTFINANAQLASTGQVTGLDTALNAKQPLDATLTALAGLDSNSGFVTETSADTFTKRTFANSSNISWSNADGVSGNPTPDLVATGITAGSYTKPTFDANGRATSVSGQLAAADIPTLTSAKISDFNSAASAAAPVQSVNTKTGTVSLTTTDISEGTNLYYTNARASAAAPVQTVAGRTGNVTLSNSDISGLGTTATLNYNAGLGAQGSNLNAIISTASVKTANYTTVATDHGKILPFTISSSATLTLDTTVLYNGWWCIVANNPSSTQNVLVTTSSGTINNLLTPFAVRPYFSSIFIFDGTNFRALYGSFGSMALQDASNIGVTGGSIDGTALGQITPSSGKFTTISASGQITSTLANGTAPLVVTSSTRVANLNAATCGTADTCTTVPAITGAVTTNGSTNVTTLSNNIVNYANIQTESANTLLGNPTGSTANVREITLDSSLSFSGTTLKVTTPVLQWSTVTGTTQTIAVNNGYIANNASLITFTLPTTAAAGDIFAIVGKGAGGWKIAQNTGQTIYGGDNNTVTTSGFLTSTRFGDTVFIECITANTDFKIISCTGFLSGLLNNSGYISALNSAFTYRSVTANTTLNATDLYSTVIFNSSSSIAFDIGTNDGSFPIGGWVVLNSIGTGGVTFTLGSTVIHPTSVSITQQYQPCILYKTGASAYQLLGATYFSNSTSSSGTAYTAVAADSGGLKQMTAATAITITINSGLGAGFCAKYMQAGAGQITFSAGTGVTLFNAYSAFKSAKQYSVVNVEYLSNTTYVVYGDVTQ